MTTEELEQALADDLAQKGLASETPKSVALARYCLQNAAVAARAAECALVACVPPAVVEAQQAAKLALDSLEQALVLLSAVETPDE